jgi:hypothetical protein
VKNLNRARILLEFYDNDTKGRSQATKAARELLRSALVFAIGALDAYLNDLILEIIPRHISAPSRALQDGLREIAKKDPSLALRVALADSDQARREEFYRALNDWLANQSFQGPDKVVKAHEYLGCEMSWRRFSHIVGFPAAEELRRITKRRHEIVHRSEDDVITRDEAQSAIDLVEKLAVYIDDQICVKYGLPPPGSMART